MLSRQLTRFILKNNFIKPKYAFSTIDLNKYDFSKYLTINVEVIILKKLKIKVKISINYFF